MLILRHTRCRQSSDFYFARGESVHGKCNVFTTGGELEVLSLEVCTYKVLRILGKNCVYVVRACTSSHPEVNSSFEKC